MKSYLRFLSRNKLYTIIEVVGLSVALAFVIVLSSYIVDDMSVNGIFKDTGDIYLHHPEGNALLMQSTMNAHENIAEIDAVCNYSTSGPRKSILDEIAVLSYQDRECAAGATSVDPNFFEFFNIPFKEGDPATALEMRNSVLLSEETANTLFPDGDAMGKTVRLFEVNPLKRWYSDITADLDMSLTVTGIFRPYENTIFHQNEIIVRYDVMAEAISEITSGMLANPNVLFIKVGDDKDPGTVAEKINDNFHDLPDKIVLTPFDYLREVSMEGMEYFTNHRPVKLFNIYLIMCIFITVVSLIDYIVLTVAFSRFRIKEIATRQLLGTDRRGVMTRCFSEALVLIAVSYLVAIVLALALKEPVGQILGTRIEPMSHMTEILILCGIILTMVVIAGAVPSYILASYKPVNVIKGEARYNDKTLVGKLFIGFAGFLCVASLSICLGIVRQVSHLANQPLGYETEDVVYVQFQGDKINRYYDELESLPFVSKSGAFENLPHLPSILLLWTDDDRAVEIHSSSGNRAYFEILGIDIHEEYDAPANSSGTQVYMCEGSSEIIPLVRNAAARNDLGFGYTYNGTASDYKVGGLKYDNTGKPTCIIISDSPGYEPIMKVNIDEDEAIRRLEDFYRSKGYDDSFFKVSSLDREHLEETKEERNMLKLVLGFSLICILMTGMCVVGLSSYYGKTSEKDNAIRNVFGCPKKEMIRKTVLNFILPVALASLAAIPTAYLVIDRWLENYVIRTDNSPLTYIMAFVAVMCVVIIATVFQTIRLMRTNPSEVLKKE